MLKSRPDRCQRVGVLNVEELESPFGNQAEAECGIGWILLENFNLDFQFAALEQVGKIKAGGSCPDDCDSHRHFLLGFAAVFATDLRGYSCLAGRIREARDDLGRDGLSLNRAGPFRMRGSPNPFLKAFDHKLSILQYTVPHCRSWYVPTRYLALHDDLVIKAARHNKLRSHFHYRHANDPIFLPHGERLQAGAFEQPSGARVKDEEVLRIKYTIPAGSH